MLRMLLSSPNGHRRTVSIKRPHRRTRDRAAAGSRRRLGYAGGTRRSAQSVGLNALKTAIRQAVDSARDGAHHFENDCRDQRGRMADAANGRRTTLIRVVMVDIGRAVHVARPFVTAMHMQIDCEIVVKVDGLGQHRCGLRHDAAGRRRL